MAHDTNLYVPNDDPAERVKNLAAMFQRIANNAPATDVELHPPKQSKSPDA